jgi:hypothetical protein
VTLPFALSYLSPFSSFLGSTNAGFFRRIYSMFKLERLVVLVWHTVHKGLVKVLLLFNSVKREMQRRLMIDMMENSSTILDD